MERLDGPLAEVVRDVRTPAGRAVTRNRPVRGVLALAVLVIAALVVPGVAMADPPEDSFSGGAVADQRPLSDSDEPGGGRDEHARGGEAPGGDAKGGDGDRTPGTGTLRGLVFPVRGRHTFGIGAGTFGSPRGGRVHQGQDVMAACGTPLVAAAGGVIARNTFQGLAGNYVVIDGRPADFVYMHLAARSPLAVGTPVRAGQPVGTVGATGNARGCHLHFEIWTEPGYQRGGQPIDPLPVLRGVG
jgi:murein DD-endopeptidase MepM/ murein hydrolase activator NlpD